jgi:hypothetical protein
MMAARELLALFILTLLSLPAHADDQGWDAALGGALGGGFGAYLGNELGGRDGAILGGALGGAAGAAISSERFDDARRFDDVVPSRYQRHPPAQPGKFCPPGQAKKGRC